MSIFNYSVEMFFHIDLMGAEVWQFWRYQTLVVMKPHLLLFNWLKPYHQRQLH